MQNRLPSNIFLTQGLDRNLFFHEYLNPIELHHNNPSDDNYNHNEDHYIDEDDTDSENNQVFSFSMDKCISICIYFYNFLVC